MKIAVFAVSSAQVHFYKNIVAALEADGNQVFVLTRDDSETVTLLNELEIPFFLFSRPDSKSSRNVTLPHEVVNAFQYLKGKHIDLTTGWGTYSTFTARLLNVPDVTFNDSECTTDPVQYALSKLSYQFTNVFVTPSSFKSEFGAKHLKLQSYKELAYLHPNYFEPDPSVFDLLGISRSHDYSILWFEERACSDDPAGSALTDADKISLVKELSGYGEVFIFSGAHVPPQIAENVLTVPSARMHDVLYYASLSVADGQTPATEAALLGTPTIRSNAFVGRCDVGVSIELEHEFHLLFNLTNPNEVASTALQLIKDPRVKQDWHKKRDRMLERKLDMTALMVCLIEDYPESVTRLSAASGHHGIDLLNYR